VRHLRKLVLGLAAALLVAPVHAQQPSPEQQASVQKALALAKELHPAKGDVAIPEAGAMLHLGDDYYYLPAAEAKRVIVEAWGNPPESADGVLGLVFPAGTTFMDDTWGAVISFDPVGYVTDDDAQSEDYGALLKQIQESEEELNAQRKEGGYPAQHLVGWAQQPVYDAKTHSVIWAQNIAFQGNEENTLNYDVRLLGRRGVLSLNMITGMSKLDETRAAAAKFAGSATFNPGARYADYRPGADKKAEFGVAGLVAAGVGVAAAKKLGLIGLVLAFGKKLIVLILAFGAGLWAWIKRRLRRGEEEYADAGVAYEELPADDPHAFGAEETGAALAPPDPDPKPSAG
jgi:uncharacterized membrane-anchored protein